MHKLSVCVLNAERYIAVTFVVRFVGPVLEAEASTSDNNEDASSACSSSGEDLH